MYAKFLAFVLVTIFLVTAGCSKQKVISEDTKSSEISETEDNIYQNTKTINKDVFSKLTKKQQKAINKIIDNIETYDKDKVIPENIDKNNFVIYSLGEGFKRHWIDEDFVVEVKCGNNKVVIILSQDDEIDNKFSVINIHLANEILNEDLPTLNEVDFLNDEQKKTFKNALELLSAYKKSPTDFCNFENEIVEIEVKLKNNDYKTGFVLCDKDKFATYKEFKEYVYNIFTKEFWDNLEFVEERFIEVDGKLYCNNGAGGGNIFYLGDDTFELISKDQNKIEFDVVSHYSYFEQLENAPKEWGYIEKNKAVLEKIDGEWKFSELVYPC